jgi:4-hydroxymandelate oxidase
VTPPALQQVPADVFRAADYEPHARRALDANAWAYLAAHAGDGSTRRANREAWDALELLPRVLRPWGQLQTTCPLFGRSWPTPLLVAPMALQRLAHPDGEVATALAAAAQGVGMVVSSEASVRLETIAKAAGIGEDRGPFWFQLYFPPDRGATLDLVRRAEAAGCEALVVTVDAAARGARPAFRLPPGIATVNLPSSAAPAPATLQALGERAPGWHDIAWLRAQTRLPLVLKGVLHPADVREAVAHQVDGLIVSNHGGRTLDGAAATARALPAIVAAASGALPVLVDGGIQRGTDVLKALALGADAVLVGRPVLWALATAGAAGVAHVLKLLRDELELALAQCGLQSLSEARADLLLRGPRD